MKKSGFAFHCHHHVLCEYAYDYDERVRYIKKHKPEGEQELRLRLFKMIPDDRVPDELRNAGEAYDKAREAHDKARKAYGKAWEAYGKVLEQHHTELCPDCPWDGETIFGGK